MSDDTRSGVSGKPTVVLGVTGCIAAYKAAELVRAMCGRGWRVKVVMTEHATAFITALTLQTLSGEPVAADLLGPAADGPLPHLSIAEEADCLLVAPATANFIAKAAHGVADDLLTTTVLASRAPLVVAPAMNTAMWTDDATRTAVRVLEERGAVIVSPESGPLACGDEGEGRLAALEPIVDAVWFELSRARALAGRRVVVTAGGTQEPMDPVRFIGNRSSGRMGYAVADEAARMGADVVLISAPTMLARPNGVEIVDIRTALEMRDAVLAHTGPDASARADALVMAAAVADYRPQDVADRKPKKGEDPVELRLVRNPDILSEVGAGRRIEPGLWPKALVGFAAESVSGTDLVEAASAKLEAKALDLVVGNDIMEPGLGFESETNHVVIVGGGKPDWVGPAPKREVARHILTRVAVLLGK